MKLFISFDSGNNWELIAITENDGVYNWQIPSKNSKNCLIKIENIDNSSRAISKKTFRIDGPEIEIISPSQDVFFSGGDKAKIAWKTKKLGNELINIFYSKDNGYSWHNIANNIVDVGLYIWNIPHLDQIYEQCLIKIESNSGKVSNISKQFTIINKSNKIRIKYPNGGELVESNQPLTIKWEANGLKANLFKILFSDNSGNTWSRIESRVLNVNEYLWITPKIESEDCLIKIISVENEDIYDISEQSFKISKKPSIKISNPLDNSLHYSEEEVSIKWNSVNVRGKKVNLYYSVDKGKKWDIIKRGVPNNGKFDWDISSFDTTSTFSKIKIELSNNIRINDINKGYFTIYGKPEISLSSSASQSMIEDKTTYRINWTSKNIRENRINLYYSTNDGESWQPIEIDILNKNFYDWNIPSLKTASCIFKVESVVQPDIFSISNYPINIIDRPLILIKNNLNDLEFNFSDSININWESYNLSDLYIDILYSEDSGKNWKIIHKNIIDLGSKKIKVPFVSKTSNQCKIKVVDSDNSYIYAISLGLFEVKRPKGTIELLDLNKKIYYYDDSMRISWNQEYMDDKVGKLYYSTNNTKDWVYIDEIDILKGYFNWEIPNLELFANKCFIKIIVDDTDYNFINNLSTFEIMPAPFINIENSVNEIVKTDLPFEINISSRNTDNISYDLYYSFAFNWTLIDKNITKSDYLWNVPSIKGYEKIKLKAQLSDDSNIYDIVNMSALGQNVNLSVLIPNGNEKYSINDKIVFDWNVKKIYDKTIDIYYSLDGGLNWKLIKSEVENSGKYIWLIDNKNLISKKCKVKIQSNTDNNIFDVSDGLFEIQGIVPFNVITPNDGDILYRGTSTFIYWDNIDKTINNVDIFYSLDKGQTWNLINKNLNNVGKYNWAVPNSISSSSKCLIKIVSSNNNKLVDYSDNTFIIK